VGFFLILELVVAGEGGGDRRVQPSVKAQTNKERENWVL